jgi:hypothetical protein
MSNDNLAVTTNAAKTWLITSKYSAVCSCNFTRELGLNPSASCISHDVTPAVFYSDLTRSLLTLRHTPPAQVAVKILGGIIGVRSAEDSFVWS